MQVIALLHKKKRLKAIATNAFGYLVVTSFVLLKLT